MKSYVLHVQKNRPLYEFRHFLLKTKDHSGKIIKNETPIRPPISANIGADPLVPTRFSQYFTLQFEEKKFVFIFGNQ